MHVISHSMATSRSSIIVRDLRITFVNSSRGGRAAVGLMMLKCLIAWCCYPAIWHTLCISQKVMMRVSPSVPIWVDLSSPNRKSNLLSPMIIMFMLLQIGWWRRRYYSRTLRDADPYNDSIQGGETELRGVRLKHARAHRGGTKSRVVIVMT
ncbi:uncharacterized protein G2W53_041117 [Senna tora]|uniref:Uncharacterized protein n=1 Tax=Senna tora TaxID=362788 RepID=A0A834SEL5_9FABA|nr:uncharacterized protein G2W53_041117 [Senna tora]